MSTNINLNKLPEITLAFWVMKICATTLGETAGDLLSMTLNVGYAMSSLILISTFLVTLGLQLFSKSHNPVVLMTDFIRHASVESVRSANGHWVYVTGGMNTLREKLHELYQQHQSSVSPLVAN